MSASGAEGERRRRRSSQEAPKTWIDPEDGSLHVQSAQALRTHPQRITDRLAFWAKVAPDRHLLLQREVSGSGDVRWVGLSYRDAAARARVIGQALLQHGLGPRRPLLVAADASATHACLVLGGLWAGVPVASLARPGTQDWSRTQWRGMVEAVAPAMLVLQEPLADDLAQALQHGSITTVVALHRRRRSDPHTLPLRKLLDATPDDRIDAAHAALHGESVARLLLTSGLAGPPRAIVATQRMLCASQQMLRQSLGLLSGGPPVVFDRFPWSHPAGAHLALGLALYNGGTLCIDPTTAPSADAGATAEAALQRMAEVAPSLLCGLPADLAEMAVATVSTATEAPLRRAALRRLRLLLSAGAAPTARAREQLARLASARKGPPVVLASLYGLAETASVSLVDASAASVASEPAGGSAGQGSRGALGLPCPGVAVKLVPWPEDSTLHEIRLQGTHVSPARWVRGSTQATPLDADGFLCTGDLVRWGAGVHADHGVGRWVGRAGDPRPAGSATIGDLDALEQALLELPSSPVGHVVVVRRDSRHLGLLLFPGREAAPPATAQRRRAEPARTPRQRAVGAQAGLEHGDSAKAQAIRRCLLAQQTAGRLPGLELRAVLLEAPPSLDEGELNAAGAVVTRRLIDRRQPLIEAMFAGTADGLMVCEADAAFKAAGHPPMFTSALKAGSLLHER